MASPPILDYYLGNTARWEVQTSDAPATALLLATLAATPAYGAARIADTPRSPVERPSPAVAVVTLRGDAVTRGLRPFAPRGLVYLILATDDGSWRCAYRVRVHATRIG